MEKLLIEETVNTPKIVFNPQENVFEISGSSYPENPIKCFSPILAWAEEYVKQPNKLTELTFRFQYFNSSTAKYILNILWVFEKITETSTNKVVVNWYYDEETPDGYAAGERYSQLSSLEFRLVKV